MDYLELTVAVRPQATDAAADLVRAVAPAGVSIEAPFEALDEEGRVRRDESAPVTLRAWLPDDASGRRAVMALRRTLRGLVGSPTLRARTVSDAAWRDKWKQYFPVTRVGRRTVIKPSWRKHRRRRDDVVIELDPGLAFGTGQHATTRMCLEALESRLRPGATVLDVGCGSGILSIGAALLGAKRVDAVDVDPAAVRATKENSARNGVERVVRVAQGSLGKAWPFRVQQGGRYDLVLANLSAGVVSELGKDILASLRADGRAIISGVVEEQADACRANLRVDGGQIEETRHEEGWMLFVVSR